MNFLVVRVVLPAVLWLDSRVVSGVLFELERKGEKKEEKQEVEKGEKEEEREREQGKEKKQEDEKKEMVAKKELGMKQRKGRERGGEMELAQPVGKEAKVEVKMEIGMKP